MDALSRAQRALGEANLLIEVLEEIIEIQKAHLDKLGTYIVDNADAIAYLNIVEAAMDEDNLARSLAEQAAADV